MLLNISELPPSTVVIIVAYLFLGITFLASSLGKLLHFSSFIHGVVEYQLLPPRVARAFGILLPFLELILAFLFALGIMLPITGVITTLLFLCFTVAVHVNIQRGRIIKCSCYGIASTSTIGIGTLVRNILLILISTFVSVATYFYPSPDQFFLLSSVGFFRAPHISSVVLLALLLAFCIVFVQIIEWAIDIHDRVTRLRKELVP